MVGQFGRFSMRYLLPLGGSALGLVFATATLSELTSPAHAQWERDRPATQHRSSGRTPQSQPKTKPVPVLSRAPEAGSPLLALISIGSQRLDIYDRQGLVASSPISSGRTGHESPQGIFSVIEKKAEHFSNLYDDASMPFMQRITWSGVAMHAGALPGYPASHGCIRLPHGFARTWFDMTKLNTRVVITQNATTPSSISHAALFQPRAVATAIDGVSQTPVPVRPALPRDTDGDTPMMLGVGLPHPEAATAMPAAPATPQKATLTPSEAARLRQSTAAQRHAAAVKGVEDARKAVKAAQLDIQKVERTVKAAELTHKRAALRLAAAERGVSDAGTDEARASAEQARMKIAEELGSLIAAFDDAKSMVEQRVAAHEAARAAIKVAEDARSAAQVEIRDAARMTEPISVFVSRATQRVYVRQNRERVLDLPIVIRNASQPIGTQVFTAMGASDAGRSIDWSIISAASTSSDGLSFESASAKRQNLGAGSLLASDAREQAMAALDRLEFPKEVLDRVLPSLHVGSSLIISDLGPSFETGKGTDFIVQTRGEEEARASVRRIVAEKRVGRSFDRDRLRDRRYAAASYRVNRSSSSWWWD